MLCQISSIAQGVGIFLINKLSQIKKWSKDTKGNPLVYCINVRESKFINPVISLNAYVLINKLQRLK